MRWLAISSRRSARRRSSVSRSMRSQFAASAEFIRRLVPLIESLGLKLGPEIHAPLGVKSPPVMQYREMYDKG